MRAIAITPGKTDSAREIEAPRPAAPPDGALVRVLEIGVCATDSELIAGHIGWTPAGEDHLVIGHESIGMVEEVGPQARELHRGDLVVAMVRRPDDCPACLAGNSDVCTKGKYTERGIHGAHGYLAEAYADREPFLVRVPPSQRSTAVLLEPASVAVKALRHAGRIQQRLDWAPQRTLVLGAGSLGLLAAFLLRLRGLEVDVYSREPRNSARVALLERSGARYITGLPDGPYDFIFEAAGSPQLTAQAIALMGPNGVLALLGINPVHEQVTFPLGALNNVMVQRNQVIFGSVNANRIDFDAGLEDMAKIEHQWPGLLGEMITRRVPLSKFQDAIARRPDDIKVVIEVS
jgi:threonine dehydrogenase-like Zn-dependent dehydrogenase